jgi:hypothetical protein
MKRDLLATYLKLFIESSGNANVPNQLIDSDDDEKKSNKDEVEDVNEFSGVGSIAGFTAPLGAGPATYYDKKPKAKKRK